MKHIELDGTSLTLDDLAAALAGDPIEVAIAPAALERVARARALVEERVAAGAVVYGLTTGFGKLKNVAVGPDELVRMQRNLVVSHSVGVGDPLPEGVVRVAQLLSLNGLVHGNSGVRIELVQALARLFNARFVPVVPEQGSVGASGDLAPLAHIAAAGMGLGEAWVEGTRQPASAALERIGEPPLELQAKEGLALINGTEVMTAVGVSAVLAASNLSKAADVVGGLSLEALFGSLAPFDERLIVLRGHEGQRRTAANFRRLLSDSGVQASHADCDRVQDPYSLRCIPQVHGAFKSALAHVRDVITSEINSVTDNPILFPETGQVISAGLFHGQPIAVVMDYLALASCALSNISERRCEQLVNPDLPDRSQDLPAFLTPRPGVNSGFMIAQVAAAALASENKSLAHPASVDTIPTSANQEDHVSMGPIAARKARRILEHVAGVLAIEWLCAAQGREFHRDLAAGPGAEAAHALLREHVPALEEDRYLEPDIRRAGQLLRSGALVQRVEEAVGELCD